VARALVGVLLLAQLTIAAYACPGLASALQGDVPSADGAANHAATATSSAAMIASPSCDDMAGAMDPESANLCAEHCKYGQQGSQASTVAVPVALLAVLYATPLVPETAPPPRPAAATMSALVAASPPLAILHCVYRI
jgi:hypothetical protein